MANPMNTKDTANSPARKAPVPGMANKAGAAYQADDAEDADLDLDADADLELDELDKEIDADLDAEDEDDALLEADADELDEEDDDAIFADSSTPAKSARATTDGKKAR